MILMFDSVGWFNNLLRPFFGGIDYLLYTLLGWVIEGIFNLSSIFASKDVTEIIYTRIYTVLAIFMVFKLTFSFIKYVVSPDTMVDKEQGVGKIIARTLTMLAILIILPTIFFKSDIFPGQNAPILTMLQNGVIKTLPKVILGISDDNGNTTTTAKENGNVMALNMLSSLYYPNECKDAAVCDSDNKLTSLSGFSTSLNMTDTNSSYVYYYMWPLTTLCGIILVFILVGIAVDVAIRVFKLMILQMIAPIPVMTYIDPKSSKDGAFNSWIKTFTTTYLDIFIKLGTVYLLLLLVKEFFSGKLFGNVYKTLGFASGNFVMIFLIIGLFQFAKQAPKFIKDALGIKDSGGGSFMGKALSGMAGAAAGFAGGLATGGLAGGLSGIMTGASSGLAGKPGQAFAQVRDEQAKLLGKTPGGIKGKLQNQAMQRSVMKHTGLSKKKLDELKGAKIEADNELAIAEADYANGKIDASALTDARKKAGTANSAYESANSLAKQIGLKPGFMQENKVHGNAYIAAARVRKNIDATASSVKGKINDLPSTQWIKGKATDISNIPSNVRHSIDSARYGEAAAADLSVERQVVKEDLNEYKESFRGGIGNKPDAKNQEFLRTSLKNDKKALRDDRKDFKNNK
ncbi:hypothetical protein [Methanobrevibacter smithii]|uniref:hypothetical protein n=1 Tax=Methanobrevibacter smithii TaxID=2173 RepID=UPI0037DCAE14